MSFNTSTRKEDVSLKLRAVNLHKAHNETKQLEEESRQMEERLRELKMAMTREKEERERAQSGFWNKGKQGPLTGYAQDVLLKTKLKAQKAKKIKVLKDEPVVPPVRAKHPGTMAFIAQQGSAGKENKIKGPKCGQCEQKAAQVNCLECGEEYCASCFAAFHLRGNLKKHRSVPIGAKVSRTPRGNVTPNKVNHQFDQIKLYSNGERTTSARLSEGESSKRSAQNDSQQSLLEGEYNEADSAATFQQALKAWRGDDGATQQEIKHRPVSPVRSPIVSTEHGTSTESGLEQKMPDITFHSSLSYAEKLMLKRHRRTELQPLPSDFTPRSDCRSRSSEYSSSDEMKSLNYKAETESFDDEYEETLIQVLSEPTEEENDGIQWQTIHRAMKSDNVIPCEPRSDSRLSIIELDDDVSVKSHHRRDRGSGKAHRPAYSVVEVGYEEDMEILSARKQSARSTRSSHSANKSSSLRKRGQEGKVLPFSASKQQRSRKEDISVTPSAVMEDKRIESVEIKNEPSQEAKVKKQDKESRPQSCRRPKSSRAAHSRPQSRAMSRAETRLALFGEGELTKVPSVALKEVAHLSPRHNTEPFLPTMSEFFTFGSEDRVESASSRVTTPSKTKRSKEPPCETEIPKWKVSYNLYSMGPRSWKPERSLQDQVGSEQAAQVVSEISEQLNVFLSPDEVDPAVAEEMSLTSESSIMNKPDFTNRSRPDSSHYKMAAPSESVTPRVVSSRSKVGQNSLARPSSRPQPSEGTPRPESRAIVVDGDDLTEYDFEDKLREQDVEDEETLYQLEWELASQDGRLTEDGKISRLSLMTTPEVEELDESPRNEEHTILDTFYQDDGHLSPGASLDMRMNNLMEDFEEMEQKVNDEEDVKALDS